MSKNKNATLTAETERKYNLKPSTLAFCISQAIFEARREAALHLALARQLMSKQGAAVEFRPESQK